MALTAESTPRQVKPNGLFLHNLLSESPTDRSHFNRVLAPYGPAQPTLYPLSWVDSRPDVMPSDQERQSSPFRFRPPHRVRLKSDAISIWCSNRKRLDCRVCALVTSIGNMAMYCIHCNSKKDNMPSQSRELSARRRRRKKAIGISQNLSGPILSAIKWTVDRSVQSVHRRGTPSPLPTS